MIGTEDGCWFSLNRTDDGMVAYTFHQWGDDFESGVCLDRELNDRFDRFVTKRRKAG